MKVFKNIKKKNEIKLSKKSKELLNLLVSDFTSHLGKNEFDKKNSASYIYNLFIGKYQFSFEQFKELFKYLSSLENENVKVIRKKPLKY